MLRIVWDARSTVCRTASAKLSEDRPDSSMKFTTAIVPSLIVRARYGPPETAGMQLGAGVVRAQRHLRGRPCTKKSPVTEGGAQFCLRTPSTASFLHERRPGERAAAPPGVEQERSAVPSSLPEPASLNLRRL